MCNKDDISVIVGCRNRMQFLKQSLITWLKHDNIKEIIIVDWGSVINVSYEIGALAHNKIKIYRVDNVDKWMLSLAMNFAADKARFPLLLKLDADSKLSDDFFIKHPLKAVDSFFYAGNWKIARNNNEKHLNGVLYIPTPVFKNSGGYNEYIRTYGYDDSDLYARLVENGFERKNIMPESIQHIEHGDNLRVISDNNSDCRLEIIKNMQLSELLKWNATFPHTQYQLISHQTYNCLSMEIFHYRVVDMDLNKPCADIVDRALIKALINIIAEHGFPYCSLAGKSKDFLLDLYNKKTRPKFIIEPKNGLGNRLRALASAAVLAEKSNRALCVVWKRDTHFGAKFSELFDESNMLVSETNIFTRAAASFLQQSCDSIVVYPNSLFIPTEKLITYPDDQIHYPDAIMLEPFPFKQSIIYPDAVYAPVDRVITYPNGDISYPDSVLIYPENGLIDCFKNSSNMQTSCKNDIIKNYNLAGNDDIYVESACSLIHPLTSWALEAAWLKTKLTPRQFIQHQINAYSTLLDIKNCIGVHIRMGQPANQHSYEKYFNWELNSQISILKNRKLSHYLFYMEEMERIWLNHPSQKFYLCADNKFIYDAFMAKYPEMANQALSRILYIPKKEYNRTTGQLIGAVLDTYLLSKTKYILGSSWSSFTELAQRLGCSCTKYSGKDFARVVYGAMLYNNSCNLGDNIQTLALLQFLRKKVDLKNIYWVDRDNIGSTIYDIKGSKISDFKEFPNALQLVTNGWFDGRLTKWPPHCKIIPLMLSIHINETDYILADPKYKRLASEMEPTSFFDSVDKINYFYENAPIGCRDSHTIELLNKHNIPNFYSGCLTLTFKRNPSIQRTDKILIVDSHILFSGLLKKMVPVDILARAEYRSQALRTLLPNDLKLEMAQNLLDEYQECKFVITSRLHCALPCLAFGIPVIFIFENILADCRFDKTMLRILGLTDEGILPCIDWKNITITDEQQTLITSISGDLEKRINKFLE